MTPLAFGLIARVDRHPAVFYGDKKLPMTPMAARLLIKLASAAPHVVLRSELVGMGGRVPNSQTLRVHLHTLRRALPPTLAVEYVPDTGYRLAAA